MCRKKIGEQEEIRTLKAMYAEGEEQLRQAGIEEAGLDAWYLLEFVTGVDKAHYYMNPDRRMEQSVAQEYEKAVKLRTEHIPLQHITGVQEFMGLEFQVSGDVLIPRQDTEVLVEEALKLLEQEKVPKEKETVRMLDLCTGSGCILISILYYAAKEKIQIQGTGADISEAALRIAEENLDLLEKTGNKGMAELLESDLFERVEGRFGMIASNPPYIRTSVISGLKEEVRLHDPLLALDGKEDGLFFYRKIIEESRAYLQKNGVLLFEIGYDQGEAVSELMTKAGYSQVVVKKDLAGLDRIVCGVYTE
nr:peptide chain release factor N(5)-glutamine methyltransferase [uncultured Mediterraneibacter sp.]